jgi:DNA invertase Pin-like site-specific DNA recombinase
MSRQKPMHELTCNTATRGVPSVAVQRVGFELRMENAVSIAVYVRVSTEDQDPESQKRDVTCWLKGHSHDPKKVLWFIDKETGKTLDRKEFTKLKTAIFNGDVKTVVCWRLDRLSRRLLDGIQLVAEWCEQGVRVVSVTQQIDLAGTMGKIIAAVLFGFAEIELETLRERQRAGIEAAKAKGVYKGGKPGRRKADPARAHTLRSQYPHLTVTEIACSMGVGQRTVERYLATPLRAKGKSFNLAKK